MQCIASNAKRRSRHPISSQFVHSPSVYSQGHRLWPTLLLAALAMFVSDSALGNEENANPSQNTTSARRRGRLRGFLSKRPVLRQRRLFRRADTSQQAPWKSLFDGKTLTGWKKTNFGGQGTVEVKNGSFIFGISDGLTGVTYTGGNLPKIDYEIELDAMRLDGEDFFCGLTFPVNNSHCSFVVSGWGGSVVGLSSIDEYDASENETSTFMIHKNKQWYHIRVRVTQAKIEAWIDKKKKVDLELKGRKISTRIEMDESKPLGVASWNTKAAIRNIRIRRLQSQ